MAKTAKERNLDHIIEETKAAKDHLEEARRIAEDSGDKDGAKELADEADTVDKTHNKFKSVRDKKTG